MKKTLIALAIATAGLAVVPAAFAQSAYGNGSWFVNGNVGRTSIDKGPYDGHDTGYGINGGYRWTVNPSVALGVEAGYNDLGNVNAKNLFNGDRVVDRGKSQLHGWTAGVNGHFNIDPKWYISARGGIYSWKGHGMESGNDNDFVRHGIDKTSWYAGAGVGYDFSNRVSLGLNYDHYDAKKNNVDLSTDMVSVSAEYRF